MRVVLAYRTLAGIGGSESYLLTVAEQLQRTGHDVVVYTHELGPMADLAKARGIRVVDAAGELPDACDGLLSQDAETAYEMAERYPGAARVFTAHSTEFAAQTPPQIADVSAAAVVMSERTLRHFESLAHCPELVRLRQPVDLLRFGRLGITRRPRKLLLFGNDHGGPRLAEVEAAAQPLGLTVELVGRGGGLTVEPEAALADADVVVGIGRCVVEAMASRKPAYVQGIVGGDGWVTPDRYALLEEDGFSGRADDRPLDTERMAHDLAGWEPSMGERNRELAYAHHDVTDHAAELVALWRRLNPRPAPMADAAGELARLVRVQAGLESHAQAFARESQRVRVRAEELSAALAGLKSTRRWRIAGLIGAPLDRLRALRRRFGRGAA